MIAIYARQSVDRPDSISIETQIAKCKSILTMEESVNTKVYSDRGYSGKNLQRPGFQQLLQDIQEGDVEKIVVYKLDRVSRSVHDFTGLCELLTDKKVAFRSCEDGITLDDSLSGMVLAQIMMVFAQFERETILQRVRDNYAERAKAGMYLGGRPPFGFVKGTTKIQGRATACYVTDPEKTQWVQFLYTKYLQENVTLGVLMRKLNGSQGISTNCGKPWGTVQIGRLLRNPAYVGADVAVYRYLIQKNAVLTNPIEQFTGKHGCYAYKSHKQTISQEIVSIAPHVGIISGNIWVAVQKKLDRNRQLKADGAGKHSWLSGLMKCAQCGYAITVVSKSNAQGHYLNCGGHKKGNNICTGRKQVMTLEQIERAVEVQLFSYLQSIRQVPRIQKRVTQREVNKIEIQIVQLEEESCRLQKNLTLIEQPAVVQSTAAVLAAKKTQLEKLYCQKESLQYGQMKENGESVLQQILRTWSTLSIAEKKGITKVMIARVEVGDGVIQIHMKSHFGNGI